MNPLPVDKDSPIWALDDSSWNYYLDLEQRDIITMSTLKETEDEKNLNSNQYSIESPIFKALQIPRKMGSIPQKGTEYSVIHIKKEVIP
jgi:hypothetical protein